MKFLGAVVATLLVATQVSAFDYQFNLGDFNGAKVGMDLMPSVAITGGLQYQKISVLTDAAGVMTAGGEASIWIPSVGVEYTAMSNEDVDVNLGVEYQMMIPMAEVTYKNQYDPQASQQENQINNQIETALDKFSSHGVNIYLRPEYKMADNFSISGTFGFRLGYAGVNDEQTDGEVWFDNTYTQFGLNYSF